MSRKPEQRGRHVCGVCGRRCHYVWARGKVLHCRGCARQAGWLPIYRQQAAARFPGQPPSTK